MPGFVSVIKQLSDTYVNNRKEVLSATSEFMHALSGATEDVSLRCVQLGQTLSTPYQMKRLLAYCILVIPHMADLDKLPSFQIHPICCSCYDTMNCRKFPSSRTSLYSLLIR